MDKTLAKNFNFASLLSETVMDCKIWKTNTRKR